MKLGKTCAGAVAFFALASVGHAADLQPVLKAPAAVDQQATGYVEVYTGWASTEGENFGGAERFNGWALGGAGRGNYWINRGMSVQVDAQAEGTSYDDRAAAISRPTATLLAATGAGAIRSSICLACLAGSATLAVALPRPSAMA